MWFSVYEVHAMIYEAKIKNLSQVSQIQSLTALHDCRTSLQNLENSFNVYIMHNMQDSQATWPQKANRWLHQAHLSRTCARFRCTHLSMTARLARFPHNFKRSINDFVTRTLARHMWACYGVCPHIVTQVMIRCVYYHCSHKSHANVCVCVCCCVSVQTWSCDLHPVPFWYARVYLSNFSAFTLSYEVRLSVWLTLGQSYWVRMNTEVNNDIHVF